MQLHITSADADLKPIYNDRRKLSTIESLHPHSTHPESLVLHSGSALGSNPTKALGIPVKGWFMITLKMEFAHALCPSRKHKFEQCHLTQASSVMISYHHPLLMGPRACMKTSVLEMRHSRVIKLKLNTHTHATMPRIQALYTILSIKHSSCKTPLYV